MPQIPTVPLKTIVLFHLFLFTAAMWVSPLSASWLWTNVFVLLLMLRLLETPVTGAEPSAQVAEVCVCLYALTIVNDIICFGITDAGLTAGQKFSLTMACFSMAAKPFFGSRTHRFTSSACKWLDHSTMSCAIESSTPYDSFNSHGTCVFLQCHHCYWI